MDVKKPKKRGRKSKKKLKKDLPEKKIPKKRGRKPKGGKIIKNISSTISSGTTDDTPNVILHLKASTKDVKNFDETEGFFESYNMDIQKNFNLKYENIIPVVTSTIELSPSSNEEDIKLKKIWDKLLQLKIALHRNQLLTKRSACFWCTYSFDNPPIYVPKQKRGESIEVYGCFCSPECAVAYLKKETIDESTRWERYAMLNNIYGKIYNYEHNIKPAPNPFYTLDKYHGNLTIQDYRKLLFDDRLLLVVDKPLTKIVPELYEENNETPFIYGNLLNVVNKNKTVFRLKRKEPPINKSAILNTNFNIS